MYRDYKLVAQAADFMVAECFVRRRRFSVT